MSEEFKGIAPNDFVTVTKMKHIIEMQYMEKRNSECRIQKIDKDRYIDKLTGEIHEFNHIENRSDSLNSLRQTFKKLRYLINNNFEGKGNELHITLTYKENMQDTERLYSDFKRFMTRFKRFYKTSIDYLSVVEPQGRGAWHFHLLVRFNDLSNIFIDSNKVAELWEQGFVKIKSLKDVDNIGAYLSAYLADIELDMNDSTVVLDAITHQREIMIKEVDGQEKKFVKGGRLRMYPPGMNLYRKSRGIKMPERENMRYEQAKKIVGSAQPHFEKTYHIDNEDFQNTIHFQQYNTKRK